MKETNKQRKKLIKPIPPPSEIFHESFTFDFYFGKFLMYTIAGLLLLTIGLTV
jgi:hypothetical protein